MYSFFPVHGKWGSPKDQPEIAGDLPEMACRPAVPTDACIRCNFDSDAPISRESLRRPQKARKFCQVWGGYYDLVVDNSCVEATHVWF